MLSTNKAKIIILGTGDTVDDMITAFSALSNGETCVFSTYGATTSFLINSTELTARSGGVVVRNGSNFDYIIFAPAAYNYIYFGRFSSAGTLTTLRRTESSSAL